MVDKTAAVKLLTFRGEFDLTQSRQLSDALEQVSSEALVVLNLAEARYVDSSFLNWLMRLRERLSANGGRLILLAPSPTVQRLLDVTGLVRFFDIRRELADVKAELPGAGVSHIILAAREP